MTSQTYITKPHYPILDGLRGVAAILVVIFHLFEGYFPDLSGHPIAHGYLAVDFFFLLSGFVVGYAYDDRWGNMNVWDFFKRRLVRLHPLVILGVFIGAVCFWFDPFTGGRSHTSLVQLIGVMLIGFTLLPTPDIRGWGETHCLNGPCWSLLQEYIANIFYGVIVRRFNKTALWILVILSAIALTAVAHNRGDLGTGWGYQTFFIAFTRMMFPFFAGLLLFRTGSIVRLPHAFPLCSLALIILFVIPDSRFNGLLEAAIIIFGFPAVVAAGAGGKVSGFWARVCRFSGDISYPIYITHYPFIYMYTMWIYEEKPAPERVIPVAIGLFVLFILVAYASLKWYDEPVRAWLKKKLLD
jgi:peptidoglycan/LPS O-acetylase OafA/YrhL